MKKLILSQYQRAKRFYFKYERFLMPATLVVGFLVDYFTFTNIQISITFALLAIYWLFTGLIILFSHAYDADKISKKFRYLRLFSPLLLQFFFGALLSASLIFYWFSGAFSVSWPIVGIIAVLMVSNDVFRHYFIKPIVQISVYFFATVSLASVILPFIFNSLSEWLFVAAVAGGLAFFLPAIHFLSKLSPEIKKQKRALFACVVAIAFAMNALYFANIIPPIPLALREAGLYHGLKVSNGSYTMKGEPEDFLQNILHGQLLHVQPGEKIYLYTSIFAPAKVQTTIVHHWQYYDPAQEDWITKDKLSFPIAGGRQEGYKAYSFESNLPAGRWGVFVENQRGQVLARVRFIVERATEPAQLQEVVR